MAKGNASDQKKSLLIHMMSCKKKGCTICGS